MGSTKNTVITVFCILAIIAIAYLLSNNSQGRDSSLIGDRVCGNLDSQSGQIACCTQRHEGEPTIECVGHWSYISKDRICRFVCGSSPQACTAEAKICSDGSSVGRNGSNNCEFDACPLNSTIR